jgi:hypothetical protein
MSALLPPRAIGAGAAIGEGPADMIQRMGVSAQAVMFAMPIQSGPDDDSDPLADACWQKYANVDCFETVVDDLAVVAAEARSLEERP